MNRIIQALIRLERRITAPRTLHRLKFLSWQWVQVRRTVILSLILIGSLVIALISGWLSLFNRYGSAAPDLGGTYREAVSGESKNLNPLFSPSSPVDEDVVRLVFSGLLRRGDSGDLEGDLAREYNVSLDQKTYTISLRKGVKWQDGVVFTSRDVTYTVATIQDKAYQGPRAAEWRDVKVEAKGDQTVIFTLPLAYSFFPQSLTLPILPWHLLKDVPVKNLPVAAFNDHPIGTGPYSFISREETEDKNRKEGQRQEITLERNKHYFLKRPFIDRVSLRIYRSPHEAWQAYVRREVDVVSGIPPEDAATAEDWQSLRLHDLTLPQYTALFYDLSSSAAPVAERPVRQALGAAIDRRPIIREVIAGRAFPAYYPVLPGQTGYDPALPRPGYDPAAAEKLLDQAGWAKDPKSGRRAKAGRVLKVSLVTGQTSTYRKTADLIKKAWQRVGVTVELITLADKTLQERHIKTRTYDVLLYGVNLGPTGDLYPFWHSSQSGAAGLNLSNYSNSIVDRQLEQARQTSDKDQIRQKYVRAQRLWLEDAPAYILFTPIYAIGIDERVHGPQIASLSVPSDRYAGLTEWYVNLRRKL